MKARLPQNYIMTPAEKKAMNTELRRQAMEFERNHMNELDAMILWQLHEQFGFGEKRLRRFYDAFHKNIEALGERYAMCEYDEEVWLCSFKLREIGIDIEQWAEEGKES